jgi:hypothetical protein
VKYVGRREGGGKRGKKEERGEEGRGEEEFIINFYSE